MSNYSFSYLRNLLHSLCICSTIDEIKLSIDHMNTHNSKTNFAVGFLKCAPAPMKVMVAPLQVLIKLKV